MIRGKYYISSDPASKTAIDLRQSIPEFSCSKDERDDMAIYAVAYDENETPCGTGRLFIDDDSCFRIDFIGVLPKLRRKYIGDLIARMLLYRAMDLNAARIKALVPKELVYFFARYGFSGLPDDQDLFQMEANAGNLRLEGSCSKGNGTGCTGDCSSCT